MEKRIAGLLTKWCMLHKQQNHDCELAIQYGFELILNNLIKLVIILTVAVIFDKFVEAGIVLITFAGIRYYAGGRHAKTGGGCCFAMCMITFLSIIAADMFSKWNVIVLLSLFVLGILAIYNYAPFQSQINPISDEQVIKAKKRKTIFVFIILSVVVILLPPRMQGLIVFPAIIEIISIIPTIERRERYEKESSI